MALPLLAAPSWAGQPVLLADGSVALGDVLVSPQGETRALPFERTLGLAPAGDGLVAAGLVGTVDGPRLTVARMEPGEGPALLPLIATGSPAIPSSEALPVTDRAGSLLGLAWIEGDTAAPAVLYAPWHGDSWGSVETVSPAGPGSQLALTGAALDDGTVVLAWSAYDGEDDEILWARRTATWSPPRALTANDVPDVTPALTAVPGRGGSDGTVWIAWSRYHDGQYHTAVSLRRSGAGDDWSAPRQVGEVASLYPTWQPPAGSASGLPRLLLRTARPRGWLVVALDQRLTPRSRARVTDSQLAKSSREERPGEERTVLARPELLAGTRPWIEAGDPSPPGGPGRVRFRWHPSHPGLTVPWEVLP